MYVDKYDNPLKSLTVVTLERCFALTNIVVLCCFMLYSLFISGDICEMIIRVQQPTCTVARQNREKERLAINISANNLMFLWFLRSDLKKYIINPSINTAMQRI